MPLLAASLADASLADASLQDASVDCLTPASWAFFLPLDIGFAVACASQLLPETHL